MVKVVRKSVIKIGSTQPTGQVNNSSRDREEAQSSNSSNLTHAPSTSSSFEPQDLPGMLILIRKLHQECVKMMVDMRVGHTDHENRLRILEKNYKENINDLKIRIKILEIMYEHQEAEMDIVKNVINLQMQCTNTISLGLLNMQGYPNLPNPVVPILPAAEIQPESRSEVPQSNELPSNSNEDNTTGANHEMESPRAGEIICEFCGRRFATTRYLCLHQLRIPKYCARKRSRIASEQDEPNAKRTKRVGSLLTNNVI